MSETDKRLALLRAILRDNCGSDAAAHKHLGEALRLGLDPLDYCAHRFGLGNAMVWRRAALWAGCQSADATPSRGPLPRIDHLQHLGAARTLRQTVLGHDTVFLAPGFEQVVKLHDAAPATRARIRFVPPEAIEAGLARAASPQLIAGAQQNVTRLWPRASAAQDLPLHVRLGFVTLLAVVIVLVMAAGLIARPLLIPVVALLLLAPGLLRIMATFPAKPEPMPRTLRDAELPFYTVLIPLRDEVAMVPMLARAMAALDYPALGSKLK